MRFLSDVVCFFSSRRRHTRSLCDWSSDVCSSDLSVVEDRLVHVERLVEPAEAVASPDPLEDRPGQIGARYVEIGRASCRKSVDLGGPRIFDKNNVIVKHLINPHVIHMWSYLFLIL